MVQWKCGCVFDLFHGVGKGLYSGSSFQEMISGVTLMLGFWVILWHGIRLIGQILSRPDVNASTSEPA